MAEAPARLPIVGIAQTLNCCYLRWEMENTNVFTMVGQRVYSPKFITQSIEGKIKWLMSLSKRTRNQYYFYLNSNVNIHAVSKVVIARNGNKLHEFTWDTLSLGKEFDSFFEFGLSTNPYASDKITIICQVKFRMIVDSPVQSCNASEKEVCKDDVLPSLEDDYEALLNDSKFSDITLISEGKAIKAHKCILAKKSAVFAAMFDTEMREKRENIINISDINYDVLMEMVRFVYTGRVNNMDSLASELAIAADKYELNALKITCEKAMRENLNPTNVIGCIQVAEKIGMDKLTVDAIEFIVQKANDVIDKPEFNLLSPDIVRKICRSFRNFV